MAVVGAGFAGIGAARALLAAGAEVVVVEARDRLGGRADTRWDFGHAVDLGASWLHGGPRNLLKAIARDLEVAVHPTDYDQLQVLGEPARMITELDTKALNRAIAKDLRQALRRRDYARSFAAVFDALPDDLVRTVGRRGFESEYASPLRDLGIAAILPRTATGGFGPRIDRPEQFVIGGMATLLARLADGIDVRLCEPVTSIHWGDGGVDLVTNRAEEHVDAVVVTVSIGVLQQGTLRIDPPLPDAHQDALRHAAMGTMNKVALRFPRATWPDHDAFILPDGLVLSFWNLARYAGEPTLVGLVGGDEALELERLSPDQRIARCYRELATHLPGLPEPIHGLVTNWSTDPWSFGSYARLEPGARGNEMTILSTPIGDRLFLAGEATHARDPATVHGAFQSGERAAGDVLRAFAERGKAS